MGNKWSLAIIQQHIDDGLQESLSLEYKAADALGRSGGKMKEITKDVSAMANSSGGILIFGVKEFDEADKRHLPEKIEPIDQTQFSKEWLEQIINNIRPRIPGIAIHPVPVTGMSNHVVYIVEVPQSTTAHQATDWRYYKRFNFQCVPMEDYEIRDVMNRAAGPDADVEFGLYCELNDTQPYTCRRLRVIVTNQCNQVINRFKLILHLKNIGGAGPDNFEVTDLLELHDDETYTYSYRSGENENLDVVMVYQSKEVLFPKESINIGGYRIRYAFPDNPKSTDEHWISNAKKGRWALEWFLYADSMPPKNGTVLIWELASAQPG